MSAHKHTPGPWVVTPHPEPHVEVFGVGELMDDKEFQYALSHTVCYQNAEANARLIAAAPDLLEALEPFAHATLTHTGQVIGLTREDFERALAAIAKATGEPA